MNSLKTVVLGAAAGLLALGGVAASAQSLIELDCDQCVDRDAIAQRAITTSKLKNGAVKEHKLGRDVRDRLDTIESRFEFVSIPGTVFMPASPSYRIGINASGAIRPLQTGDTFLMGSTQLPHGMHIERFACTVRDSDDPGYILVSLRAQAFDTKDETERGDTVVTLSTALQSSSTDFAEISRSNESPIGIVDNEHYQYHLRLDMLDLAGSPSDLQLLGCRVALLKPL